MPIGSAKIGVLGAGLVPGGTQTFNASGTFSVPPGVKKVNITGKGATGNPGNPGNSGTAGNPGRGAGGGGGASSMAQSFSPSCAFYKQGWPGGGTCGGGNGGCGAPAGSLPSPSTAGSSGNAGNAGSAGSAGTGGNPGSTGNASSGLTYNFTGGAGGNAGSAGNAGTAGNGGTGGGGGGTNKSCDFTIASPGSGGNGGGAGYNSNTQIPSPGNVSPPCSPNFSLPNGNMYQTHNMIGWGGGGGAGDTNPGGSGTWNTTSSAMAQVNRSFGSPAGAQPVPWGSGGCGPQMWAIPAAGLGGNPGGGRGGFGQMYGFRSGPGTGSSNFCSAGVGNPTFIVGAAGTNARAGGGGGAGGIGNRTVSPYPFNNMMSSGGGGGGGGRGNAGNAGGTGGTGGAGSAATPATYNCVPVTPGSPYPITVASPGGQVVISWNPQ